MSSRLPQAWLVSVLDGQQTPVGLGVLVAPGHCITCTHVVAAALGVADGDELPLGSSVALRSWKVRKETRGTVLRAFPPDQLFLDPQQDICLLEVADPSLTEASWNDLTTQEPRAHHRIRACGHSRRASPALIAKDYTLSSELSSGWWQINPPASGSPLIDRGFSGSLAWDMDEDKPVGIVVGNQHDVSYVIPCALLREACAPPLAQGASSSVAATSATLSSRSTADVFLCHNSQDKPSVRELAHALQRGGLRVWLDEWELRPGQPWQEALEQAITTVRSAAILVGPHGPGPWADREMRAFLDEFVQREIPVIPVLLPGVPRAPQLPIFLRSFTWVDLRMGLTAEGLERLAWGITGERGSAVAPERTSQAGVAPRAERFNLHGVPALPSEYVPRGEFVALKQQLVAADATALAIAGQSITALQGMGGVGKTTLAIALARDPDVRRAFPDGVFWVTLGQSPDSALVQLSRLVAAVSGERSTFDSETEAQERARELLAERGCLLVLDDVWELRHATPFQVLGERGKLLLTTRKEDVYRGLGARPQKLGELPPADALDLLAQYAGLAREALPEEARDIVQACGELPLALAMVGSQLRDKPRSRWTTMRERLAKADVARLAAVLPGYAHRTVMAAIEVSVTELSSLERERYLSLAVFPEDSAIPEATLATYWGVALAEVQETLDRFVDAALATFDAQGRLGLHDLQHDYMRACTADLALLHRQLVSAYRVAGAGELFSAPNDGYAYDHLAAHVQEAEGDEALRVLLLDLRWIRARLEATDVNRLLADFARTQSPATRAVAVALRQASHVLRHEAHAWSAGELLGGQILGRLQPRSEPQLTLLCEHARAAIREQGGFEPLSASLQASEALLLTLEGHLDTVSALAVLPDGRLASGSWDRTIKLWDPRTQRCVATLEGHTGRVGALTVLPDGRLASGSMDATIKLWDLRTQRCDATLEGHGTRVSALTVLPDGRLASGSDDATIKLWDLQTQRCDATLEAHGGMVLALTGLPDGRLASGSVDATIKLWDPQTQRCDATLEGHSRSVDALTVLLDGRLASGSGDKTIKLWDLQTQCCDATLEGHSSGVNTLTALPDGRLASGSYMAIKLWDPRTQGCDATLEGHSDAVNALVMLPDGRMASGSYDETIKLWDPQTPRCGATLEDHSDAIVAQVVLPHRRLATASYDNTIKLWNLQTQRCEGTLEGHSAHVNALVVLPDGRLASGSRDHTIKLWNPQTQRCEGTLEGHSAQVNTLAVLPDGRLASGSDDHAIKLWNLQTQRSEGALEGHSAPVNALVVLLDGRLASGSWDHTIKLWNPQTQRCEGTLEGHSAQVNTLAVLPDGRLASGSDDHAIKLWDPKTQRCDGTFEGHTGDVRALAVLSDGRLASGSEDRTLRLWPLAQRHGSGPSVAFVVDADVTSVTSLVESRRLVLGDRIGRLHWLRQHPLGSRTSV